MPWVVAGAVIAAGGAYVASRQVKKGQEEAARIQAQQQQKALEAQQAAYKPFEPYLMESTKRYEELLTKPETFKTTPGYMFRLQEGLKAAGISTGSPYLTGAQLKASQRYGQEYASNEYQRALDQAAGLGQVASQSYQPGAQYAGALGNIYTNIGRAQAQGVLGAAEARASGTLGVSNALASAFGSYGQYRMYQQQQQAPASYYGRGQYSGYGSNVSGDAYAPAYGGY